MNLGRQIDKKIILNDDFIQMDISCYNGIYNRTTLPVWDKSLQTFRSGLGGIKETLYNMTYTQMCTWF